MARPGQSALALNRPNSMYIDFLASVVLGGAIVYSTVRLCRELAKWRTEVTHSLLRVETAIDRQTAALDEDLEYDLGDS